MTHGNHPNRSHLNTVFGPLELRVLDQLWSRPDAVCVREIQSSFPGVAYTTLMTTLDRLFRKGVLTREKNGRAFHYRPACTRDELQSNLAGTALATLLPGTPAAVRPILSLFVDAVGDRDHALLDELESLIRIRRSELEDKGSK